jgi:O-antigen/teichoic acid export membrane protein
MRLYSDREAFGGLYRGCMTAAAVLGLPIAAGVAVIAPDIIALIYGQGSGYGPASPVLQILVAQVPISFAFQVAALPLLASRREVDLVKVLLTALVVNLVLDLLLVPRFRAVGAATATLLTTVLSLLMTTQWVRLVNPARLVANILATGLMAVAAYGARELAGMWVAMGVGAVSYVALLIGLRAVSWEELRALLRRRPPAEASEPVVVQSAAVEPIAVEPPASHMPASARVAKRPAAV